MSPLPASIDETEALLARADYVADRALATVLFLALKLKRPLFLEGEAGVGKTEIAKVLAAALGRKLIRLQCYEGLDQAAALYEWNYPAQMLAIRQAEASHGGEAANVFSPRFLIRRPILEALETPPEGAPVLLIDELDRADEAFEAFLLEILSDFQVTIPELGTVRAREAPIVVVTTNRTREIHDALKRRCLYHWWTILTFARGAGDRGGRKRRRALVSASPDEGCWQFVGAQRLRRARAPLQAARRRGDASIWGARRLGPRARE